MPDFGPNTQHPPSDKRCVKVTRDGEATNLGPFDDEIKAARDRKALELHGEFAHLNFPNEAGR